MDAKDVINKYEDKPGVAKQVFDNCPPYPKVALRLDAVLVFVCWAFVVVNVWVHWCIVACLCDGV